MKSKLSEWNKNSLEYLAIKNGCDLICEDDINSIKKVKLFNNIHDNHNIYIRDCLRFILTHSMNRVNYRYGETGVVIRIDFGVVYIPVDGNYTEVKLLNSNLMEAFYRSKISLGYLICCHNHPNNSIFSFDDIFNFTLNDLVSVIIVVGNTSNIYILRKRYEITTNFDNLYKTVMNIRLQTRLDFTIDKNLEVHNKILNNLDAYCLELIHYKRGT